MEINDLIGKTITGVKEETDGLLISLDNGKKIIMYQLRYPDGTYDYSYIEEIEGAK